MEREITRRNAQIRLINQFMMCVGIIVGIGPMDWRIMQLAANYGKIWIKPRMSNSRENDSFRLRPFFCHCRFGCCDIFMLV